MSPGLMMVLLLVAATLPALVRQLYPPLPLPRESRPPRCVVVLGGGLIRKAGQRRSSTMGVRRLQRALEQARQRQLPLLISGGGPGVSRGEPGEAALLAELARGYGVTLWVEDRSRNTRENARNSAALLVRKGIDSVLLVTDRAHMPRAMLCFLHQRLTVEPAPLDSMPSPAWMPSAGALALLPEIWYEWLALVWYWLRRDF